MECGHVPKVQGMGGVLDWRLWPCDLTYRVWGGVSPWRLWTHKAMCRVWEEVTLETIDF